ncbi:hypothetical protein ACLI08_02545 [Flavobacterium sp. RNTU_13]|uniref:hypothetical protein n=1 Tax=Flavobacterium sp. RNTU_13 TaxID=3375145 RepID=UPI0039884048
MDAINKETELVYYKKLVLATLDYHEKTGFIKGEYLDQLTAQTEEHFTKSRLSKLKQWFKDLSEVFIEQLDFGFNDFLQEETGYDVNVFEAYFTRVDKIIAKGKITTDNQFYDLKNAADLAVQSNLFDIKKTEQLNKLLFDYENKKQSRTKKPI